jgi:hypothetical protein
MSNAKPSDPFHLCQYPFAGGRLCGLPAHPKRDDLRLPLSPFCPTLDFWFAATHLKSTLTKTLGGGTRLWLTNLECGGLLAQSLEGPPLFQPTPHRPNYRSGLQSTPRKRDQGPALQNAVSL